MKENMVAVPGIQRELGKACLHRRTLSNPTNQAGKLPAPGAFNCLVRKSCLHGGENPVLDAVSQELDNSLKNSRPKRIKLFPTNSTVFQDKDQNYL